MSTKDALREEFSGASYSDKDVLRTLIIDEGLTQEEIADIFDCSQGTISNWVRKHKLRDEIRDKVDDHEYDVDSLDLNGPVEELRDRDLLYELYVVRGLTTIEIGDLFGCGSSIVRYWLECHGIERRPSAAERNPDIPDALDDPNTMRELYVEQQLTTLEIADRFDCGSTTVTGRLERFGIERRPEGWRYGWEGGYGPNWGEQRRARLAKDNYQCVLCGMEMDEHRDEFGRALNVHHIIPKERFRGDDGILDYERANRLSNLVTLCHPDHKQWEGIPLRPAVE